MSNKMLIDASHPEETRVAVVRGNRIEEFDFESQERKQLRGNIYLAKVTRVEPSLQAAFVDYGGNRHGFLAFSEIHPDYYQIPMADRQALLEAEAAEARALRDAEEQETADDDTDSDEADEDETPKKKPRRRRSRKAKSEDESDNENSDEEKKDTKSSKGSDNEIPDDVKKEIEEVIDEVDLDDVPEVEEKPKPKRRTTRRKPAAKKKTAKAEEDDAASDKSDSGDDDKSDDDGNPTSMAAVVEMETISEELPDETDDSDSETEDDTTAEEKPKPKRRTSRRKTTAKKKDDQSNSDDSDADTEAKSDKNSSDDDDDSSDDEDQKPKKRSSRRRSRKKADQKNSDNDDNDSEDDDNESNDNGVEHVGQEDALEEVPNPRRQRRHYKIQEVIKRRQVLLIQVVKEERGNKGAALTTYLSLAGRYSVLMPNTARGGGISRKITNAADRKRLKAIASKLDVPNGMGVILRTAGASRTDVEINRDFEYLMRLWGQVRNLTLSSTAPCLVYEEGSLIKRSIRDLYDKDTGEILVSGEEGYNEAREFMGMLMPEHQKRVKLYKDNQAIFAKFGVESHLERMVAPQVTMKSGGYLVINQTEALVAVDVNSGRSTREHSIEDTALKTNLEAAEEVARQLRLRDLAGLIVIDFIDMEEKRNNRAVEKKLKECLKNDRARIQVGRISHFGLMEMSRQRMRSSVLESTMDVCEHCGGLGYIRSDSAIALHVFRAIEEHVSKHNKFDAVVKTNRSVAFHILNHKRAALLELEAKYGLNIILEGDGSISSQDFSIEKGDPASGDTNRNVIGFQNEAAFEAVDADDDQDDDNNNRKRRGRKRKNDDDDNSSETSAKDQSDDDEEDEDRPKRRRRRGKRGGRRNKNQDGNDASEANSSDEDNGENDKKPSRAKSKDDSDDKGEDASAQETKKDDDEKPAKSTRTKRVTQKAPVQEKPKEDASVADKEPVPEPPRPARRRTTRRVTEKTDDTAPVAASTDESAEVSKKPAEAAAEASSESVSEEASGKKGWWNRGGGFF